MDMKMIRAMFILLTLMQTMSATVYGGDTATVGISCIIPTIPGVNAPFSDGQMLNQKNQAIPEEKINPQGQESQKETSPLLQEDSQAGETQNEEGKTQLVLVRTFYSR